MPVPPKGLLQQGYTQGKIVLWVADQAGRSLLYRLPHFSRLRYNGPVHAGPFLPR
ncbi:MAG: hypothetical protein ACYC5M_04835 [Anaerolineae bacterium]